MTSGSQTQTTGMCAIHKIPLRQRPARRGSSFVRNAIESRLEGYCPKCQQEGGGDTRVR